LVRELPETFELEELQHRLYLRQKLEAAEREVEAGQVLTYDEVAEETARWFRE
jgi:hypothetical protein